MQCGDHRPQAAPALSHPASDLGRGNRLDCDPSPFSQSPTPGTLPLHLISLHHNIQQPVYVDGRVEWVENLDQKRRIWELFKNASPPLGFDPARDYISPDHPYFGVLKVIPWRIDLVSFPAESFEKGTLVWRNRGASS